MSFQQKVVLITGAGSGIGFEIARQLGRAGARVYLNEKNPILCEAAIQTLRKEDIECQGLIGDAGDVPFITYMVQEVISNTGVLDIVIANAGITLFGDFFEYAPQDFYEVMRVNLGGSFFLTQQAALHMRLQPSGGSILLMSSVVGHQAHKNLAAYAASKAGLEMLAKNLVLDLSPYRININAIAPGATLTERTLASADFINDWSEITPLGRPAEVKDIAAAALFLVSDEARHITGQNLVIDGGWTSMSPQPKH